MQGSGLGYFQGFPLVLPGQVLGRRRPDGSALISVSEMRDGIVTFEDEAEAARFGALLEADRQAEVRPDCQLSFTQLERGTGRPEQLGAQALGPSATAWRTGVVCAACSRAAVRAGHRVACALGVCSHAADQTCWRCREPCSVCASCWLAGPPRRCCRGISEEECAAGRR